MTKRLQIYLPDAAKSSLDAYLASKGMSASSYVSALIESDLPEVFDSTEQKSDDAPKEKVLRARVTDSEYVAFLDRVASEGMGSKSALLVKVLREYLNGTPSITHEQLKELREANFNLLAIGRNLNQIARRLNTEGKGGDVITPTYIERVVDYVSQQRKAILGIIDFENSRRVRTTDG